MNIKPAYMWGGAVWTVLLLASALLHGASVTTLSLLAVQGAALIVIALRASTAQGVSQDSHEQGADLSAEETQREYIAQLQQSLELQQRVVADEIERVENLINEATTTLEESFTSIYRLTLSHHEQLEDIEDDKRHSDPVSTQVMTILGGVQGASQEEVHQGNRDKIVNLVDQLDRDNQQLIERLASLGKLSGKFKFHLDGAVRAMQFEDVANQAIHAVKQQLTIFSGLNEQLQRIKSDDSLLNPSALLSCIQQCESIRKTSRERTANQAVKQENLDEGEVELF
ncbi:MAG: hypothetical protein ACPG4U_10065 [Pseudomonadales bacterium]